MKSFLIALTFVSANIVSFSAAASDAHVEVRVKGRGYLGIMLPDGTMAYSKEIFLKADQHGVLVSEDQYRLYPPIAVTPSAYKRRIGTDGTITAKLPSSQMRFVEGQVMVYVFEDPSKLKPIGAGLYVETELSGAPTMATACTQEVGCLKSQK